jgi:hypothetical protein
MPEMVTIKYDDLSAAFDFVSFAAPFEYRAFVSLDTGAIHWISETSPIDEEDLPDDLETSDRYIAVPHKNDLDLGHNLALRFAEEQLPHRYKSVETCFRHRGAYARFKDLLAAEQCLDKWSSIPSPRISARPTRIGMRRCADSWRRWRPSLSSRTPPSSA